MNALNNNGSYKKPEILQRQKNHSGKNDFQRSTAA